MRTSRQAGGEHEEEPKEPIMRITQISEPFGSKIEGSPREQVGDIDPNVFQDLVKTRGTVMFSGFGTPLAEFEQFIRQFGDDFMTYQGGSYVRQKVSADESLLSTRSQFAREKEDAFELPLHGEMYYMSSRPVVLWFFCERPADSDGETTVCDGAQIYDALGRESKELLAEKKLKYIRRYKDGEWQRIYQTEDLNEAIKFCAGHGLSAHLEDDGVFATEFLSPGVIKSRWGDHLVYINNMLPVLWQEQQLGRQTSIVRLEDDTKIPEQLVDEVVAAQKRLIIPMAWQRGDFAVLDNTRTMHGRRPFADPQRNIFLRMVREVAF
jgi:alpha-ketoglutarate-dependent taurine dioxygenase